MNVKQFEGNIGEFYVITKLLNAKQFEGNIGEFYVTMLVFDFFTAVMWKSFPLMCLCSIHCDVTQHHMTQVEGAQRVHDVHSHVATFKRTFADYC